METYIYIGVAVLVVVIVLVAVAFLFQEEGLHLFSNPKSGDKIMNNKEKSLNNPKEGAKETKNKYNIYSIIGFVLSLLSIIGIGLLGYIGIFLGTIAITQIKHTREKGYGLAWATIIIGAIWGPILGIINLLGRAAGY